MARLLLALLAVLPAVAVAFGPDKPTYISNVECEGANATARSNMTKAFQRLRHIATRGRFGAGVGADDATLSYYLANTCISLSGSGANDDYAQMYEYDASAKTLYMKYWDNADCTGDVVDMEQLALNSCQDGAIYEAQTDVIIGSRTFYEFFRSKDICEAGKTDPELIGVENSGCNPTFDETDNMIYATSFCTSGTSHTYKCDDDKCTDNCHPWFADTPLDTCVDAGTVIPSDDPDDVPNLVIKVQNKMC